MRSRISSKRSSLQADKVHLVHGDDQMRDAQERGRCRRAGGSVRSPRARASISTTARFAVEAPVIMLRVYCTWPGVSATNELAARCGEVAVRDVGFVMPCSRSARSPVVRFARLISPPPVRSADPFQGLDLVLHERFRVVEEPADERRLAVVDAAAGAETQDVDTGAVCWDFAAL